MSNDIILVLDNACGRLFTASHGIIKSENFPSPYPNYTDCLWHIEVEEYRYLYIEFSYFNLPPKKERCINYMNIENSFGNYSYTFFGGKDSPVLFRPYYFGDNALKVVFRTGPNKKQNQGFKLKYVAFSRIPRSETLNVKGM